MSLDNIQLPSIVIQDLFKTVLIDLNSDNPDLKTYPAPSSSFLGNNQQFITIIVNNEETIYLPEEELAFLLDILSACKLSMEDIALINLSKKYELNYKTISEQFHARKILLIGVAPSALELPLEFPQYQVQQYNNQVYLSVPALKILKINKVEKTKLWNCLKQLFEIR